MSIGLDQIQKVQKRRKQSSPRRRQSLEAEVPEGQGSLFNDESSRNGVPQDPAQSRPWNRPDSPEIGAKTLDVQADHPKPSEKSSSSESEFKRCFSELREGRIPVPRFLSQVK